MVKNQKLKCPIGFRIVIICLLLILIAISVAIFTSIPREVCINEYKTEKIELGHYNYIDADKSAMRDFNFDTDEYLCEDNVVITKLKYGNLIIFDGRDKTCIIKRENKSCEMK